MLARPPPDSGIRSIGDRINFFDSRIDRVELAVNKFRSITEDMTAFQRTVEVAIQGVSQNLRTPVQISDESHQQHPRGEHPSDLINQPDNHLNVTMAFLDGLARFCKEVQQAMERSAPAAQAEINAMFESRGITLLCNRAQPADSRTERATQSERCSR